MNEIIRQRAEKSCNHFSEIGKDAFIDGYEKGVTEQKAEDEKYIKLLEEYRNAFIAFCHNIINGRYISVIDAAKEQLGYLENKAMEEE